MQHADPLCIGVQRRFSPNCPSCPLGPFELENLIFPVYVAPGMSSGDQVKFQGFGNETVNGKAADIIFIVDQKPHKLFKRSGDDLLLEVANGEESRGFSAVVTGIDDASISIVRPPLFLSGGGAPPPLTLFGKGMPVQSNTTQRGNLIVSFVLSRTTPASLIQEKRIAARPPELRLVSMNKMNSRDDLQYARAFGVLDQSVYFDAPFLDLRGVGFDGVPVDEISLGVGCMNTAALRQGVDYTVSAMESGLRLHLVGNSR